MMTRGSKRLISSLVSNTRIALLFSLIGFSTGGWAQQIALTPEKPSGVYAPGEKVVWEVRVSGEGAETVKNAAYQIRKGGGNSISEGKVDLSTGQGRIETSQTEPLTYLADLTAQGKDGAAIHAYGGAVVSPSQILPSLPKPTDFNGFWAQKLADLDKIPANPVLEALPSEKADVEYAKVTLDNIWGSKVRGQIARPTVGEKFPAVIILQWAGVYGLPKNWVTGRAAEGWLALNISAHDLPIDESAEFYANANQTTLKNYATIGNDNRDKSYLLRMLSGCVQAAKYLASRPDWNGQTLVATGTSQGGYQSIALAGLFPQITDVVVNVPAGCDMAGEVAGRRTPWPYWTKQNVTDANRAAIIATSAYFDPVNFAPRIKVPVLVGLGLVDNTATPAGVLAMSNRLGGPKEVVIMPLADHQGNHNSHASYNQSAAIWLDALVKNQPAPLIAPIEANEKLPPHLLATPAMIERAVSSALHDPVGRENYARMLARFNTAAGELRASHQIASPNFSFAARSNLTDLAITYALAKRINAAGGAPTGARLSEMRQAAVAATLDLVGALQRGGNKGAGYHVGQGSNMMALAVAYDWLYDEMGPQQRQLVAAAMMDYSIRPTIQVYLRGESQWWVSGMNNWSFINGGGALMGLMALRPSETPANITSDTRGKVETQPFERVFDDLTQTVLANLSRGFRLVDANNGLWGEGPGYQHDTVFPWYLLSASLESALHNGLLKTPATIASTQKFVAAARVQSALLVNSSIYLRGPSGSDWQYSDGGWNYSDQPISFLVADYARQQNSPLWRLSAWQTRRGASSPTPGIALLYGSAFDWEAPISAPNGVKGFDPTNFLPGHVFFKRLVETKTEVGANEFLVTWRTDWTNPLASGVMFKGADRRTEMHSHLDAGTFLYDNQGVRWIVDLAPPAGYPLFFALPNSGGPHTSYQAFPKRAEAHSTLVINPTRNDYLSKKVASAWLAPVNPDQANVDGTSNAVSPVEDIQMESGARVWSGAVNYSNAYARHGVTSGSKRSFEFDRSSGELRIRDDLHFAQDSNEVFWFLQLDGKTDLVVNDGKTMVVSRQRADKTPIYLEIQLENATGNRNGGLKFGRIDENRPSGPPDDALLWGYPNAPSQKLNQRKIALHLTGLGSAERITVRLKPRPEWAGLEPAVVKQKLAAARP